MAYTVFDYVIHDRSTMWSKAKNIYFLTIDKKNALAQSNLLI